MARFSIGNKIKHKEIDIVLTIKDITYANGNHWYEFEETDISLNVDYDDKYELVNADEVFISRKTKVIRSIKIDEVNSSTIQVTFKGNIIPVTKHRELNIVIDEIKKSHPNYKAGNDADNLESIDYDNDSLTYSLTFTSL